MSTQDTVGAVLELVADSDPGTWLPSISQVMDWTLKGLVGALAAFALKRGIAWIRRARRLARINSDLEGQNTSLEAFVLASVEPGSRVDTDDWEGYGHLAALGYWHRVTVMRRSPKRPHELMARVHRVVSLLKRWLLGTHQGTGGTIDEF